MPIAAAYSALKTAAKAGILGAVTRDALRDVIRVSLEFTAGADQAGLASKVEGKSYSMLVNGDLTSRPINEALFRADIPADELLDIVFGAPDSVELELLDQALYTAAMSFPAACDLIGAGNQKSPGTFFEFLVAHLFASKFGVEPQTCVEIQSMGAQHSIPTDYFFELNQNRLVHLPVKMSTRERSVQAWAHQRMLDGMMGAGRFRGILVCLAETNKKKKDQSVVEVCVPDQWTAYQKYIATMSRVYYLDPPLKYLALCDGFPSIQVRPLSRFLFEADQIANPNWT